RDLIVTGVQTCALPISAMEATDRFLLDTRGGPDAARVVVIPTASGQEPGSPERWNRMGVEHFSALGAQVTAIMLLDRQDAADARSEERRVGKESRDGRG